MKRPSIKSPCVADRHVTGNERVAEFLTPSGEGGLISIRQNDDGSAKVEVYRTTDRVTVVPNAPSTAKFSYLQMEAALCVWEEMIELRRQLWQRDPENEKGYDAELPALPEWTKVFEDQWEGVGSSAMRSVAVAAGDIVLAVHDHMTSLDCELVGAYDWEFVPAVVSVLDWPALVQFDQFNGAAYKPDPATLFEAVKPILGDNLHYTDRRAEWMAKAKRECDKQWGYIGLMGDHAERFETAYTSGLKPADFVKELGEKYDLTPKSEWERGY